MVELPMTFLRNSDEGASTSKEIEEGGYRERNMLDLSRSRYVQRSKKRCFQFNRDKRGLLGERNHVGGHVTEGPTSEPLGGHLIFNTGPSHLGLFKAQILKKLPQEPEPFICDVNC
ncbi:hypothetical protein H5410_041353 [Solanum commersonii]|uniref:Uncharacterized protein n=1 Tax=Solanum commersonii TaxID=4109 RepID=A0A9J5XTD7_SOLCO|nr:hypothetical protein H5410_041353 [Solanum commersonii]